jgi:hypothetical protein
VPGPIESACIQALFDSLELVPIDAPTWTYTRYGPAHPATPMPVALDPADTDDTSRMHAMVGPSQAAAVNYNAALIVVRPSRPPVSWPLRGGYAHVR